MVALEHADGIPAGTVPLILADPLRLADPSRPRYIHTKVGVGYFLADQPEVSPTS
jgi:hypothetical protein